MISSNTELMLIINRWAVTKYSTTNSTAKILPFLFFSFLRCMFKSSFLRVAVKTLHNAIHNTDQNFSLAHENSLWHQNQNANFIKQTFTSFTLNIKFLCDCYLNAGKDTISTTRWSDVLAVIWRRNTKDWKDFLSNNLLRWLQEQKPFCNQWPVFQRSIPFASRACTLFFT